MRKNSFILLLVFLTSFALLSAQSPDPNTPEGMNALRKAQSDPNALVYSKATELHDWRTAIVALHHLLLKNPENVFLQDSLAALYYRTGENEACQRWCAEVLAKRPKDLFLHQLVGQVAEESGNLTLAVTHFEQLYAATRDPFFRYQVSSLQFQLGRYGEAGSNIESMLSDPQLAESAIHLDWENGGGDVPIHAALLNLRGNLELALNKENLARKSFRAALKLAPKFKLPRQNLNAIQAKHQQEREAMNDR